MNEITIEVRYEDFERQVTDDGRAYNPRVSLGIGAGDVSLSPVRNRTTRACT